MRALGVAGEMLTRILVGIADFAKLIVDGAPDCGYSIPALDPVSGRRGRTRSPSMLRYVPAPRCRGASATQSSGSALLIGQLLFRRHLLQLLSPFGRIDAKVKELGRLFARSGRRLAWQRVPEPAEERFLR